jgi:preprotein translocase subunit YajC
MFISNAYAQAAAGAQGEPSLMASVLPLVVILGIFYFLVLRPQQKRMKEHREKVNSINIGDKIVTAGGILGRVVSISDEKLGVEIAPTVIIQVRQSTVSDIESKASKSDIALAQKATADAANATASKQTPSARSKQGSKPKATTAGQKKTSATRKSNAAGKTTTDTKTSAKKSTATKSTKAKSDAK